jgi:hypothetical protein
VVTVREHGVLTTANNDTASVGTQKEADKKAAATREMSSGGVSELGASSGRHDRDLSAGGGGTYAAATAGLAVSAASVLIGAVATWRFILWRARTRLQDTVKRVQDLLPTDGPLVRPFLRKPCVFPTCR